MSTPGVYLLHSSMPTKSYFADTAHAVKHRANSLHIKSPLGASKIMINKL